MEDKRLIIRITEFMKKRRQKKRWKNITQMLACVVVFCTVYALILPAITMEKTAYCGKAEHVHSESCYTKELVCKKEETEGHKHTDKCYEVEKKLVCDIAESEEHTHTDACYKEEKKLICEKEESDAHKHDAKCYKEKLTCDKDEHKHVASCYSDKDADVETKAVWEKTLPGSMTGKYADDLAAVAESQVGYRESTRNYKVVGDDKTKGYTRYGEWYGDTYGDWNIMFVSFCLNYAKIPETIVPQGAQCDPWIAKASNKGLYQDSSKYTPKKGDIVVLKDDGQKTIGIVTRVTGSLISVVEGDLDDQVKRTSYSTGSSKVLGYVALPDESETKKDTSEAKDTTEEVDKKTEETSTEEASPEEKKEEVKKDEDKKEEKSSEQDALTENNDTDDSTIMSHENGIVKKAVVKLKGEDSSENDENSAKKAISKRAMAAQKAARTAEPGNIEQYLTSAQIKVNGEPYDGVSALNPGEQFTVALQWQLERDDLTNTLTYQYKFPGQIHIEDVEEATLYDETNTPKGIYSIENGVLTVTYNNVADLNKTTFELNATWKQDLIGQDTTVSWNDKLQTTVKFDNAQIAATKKLLNTQTMEDGSYVGEYAVNVTASSNAQDITLKDELKSEPKKIHFVQGYYEIDGKKYDYRYKTTSSDGNDEYQYANFPEGTFDNNGKQTTDTIIFPKFNLNEGQTRTVEYAVMLDAKDRFELDQNMTPESLTNTATASYPYNDDTISSTVTVKDTYRAEEKWIIKEKKNLSEGDVERDPNIPWTVKVNPERAYDMGGAVIGDHIQTKNVTYKTDTPLKIKKTTGSHTDENCTEINARWITLNDKSVSDIWAVGRDNAIDQLFSENGQSILAEINEQVGETVTRETISNYVFVNQSGNQFVWFVPEENTPTTYELSYVTDASEAESNVLTNSAGAGWKQWIYDTVIGSFLQEIKIEKENSGAYQKGDDYFVDWTITLNVPGGRNAIPNAFLYDQLPYHSESDAYDQLVGLNTSEFDYSKANQMQYLEDIAKGAFEIETTSSNKEVQNMVHNSKASLGHPKNGLTEMDYKLYESADTQRGQFPIVNGEGKYAGKRMTPTRFGIWLGDLPDTLNKDGYEITVKYTTKVDPKLVSELNGRTNSINTVALEQRNGENDILLANATSPYWVEHSTAQNVLAKSVAGFDSKNNIVTYQVNINPDANLDAIPGSNYILEDVLDLPGAQFIQNSFELSFQGTVEVDENDENAKFIWNNSQKTVLWRSDDGKVDLSGKLSAGMKELVRFDIGNPSDASSKFNLTLSNSNNIFALTNPEDSKGKFAPMVLTYKVQLPNNIVGSTQERITNSVTMEQKSGENQPVLLDGVKTTFDYTSALHKKLSVAPDGNNGYTATFVINVDKTVDEWKNVGKNFTVSDEMSKSLMVDISSIKVYGIKNDGSEEELESDKYTSSYDDRGSKNLLSVTINEDENPEYVKYRIEYKTKVQGEVGDTVDYDNVAKVEGTKIESETVEKNVYIQKQDSSVEETQYEVKLLKYDAGNTNLKLKATFRLYAYENGNWTAKRTGLTTDENGELVLNNDIYEDLGLGPNTWYKLEETSAPEGYLKGTTYFHIGQVEESEAKPDEIGSYTTIPLKGGEHQIPNYKAELRLKKVNSNDPNLVLSGAEFALYETDECVAGEEVKTVKTSLNGIYSIDLKGLKSGKVYYLKEIKAPDGYKLSNTVYRLTFDNEGKVTLTDADSQKVKEVEDESAYLIPNEASYELPQSGGIGTYMFTLGGLLLMAISLIYGYKLRLARERRGK